MCRHPSAVGSSSKAAVARLQSPRKRIATEAVPLPLLLLLLRSRVAADHALNPHGAKPRCSGRDLRVLQPQHKSSARVQPSTGAPPLKRQRRQAQEGTAGRYSLGQQGATQGQCLHTRAH